MICVTILLQSQFYYYFIFSTQGAGELLCQTSIVTLCLNFKNHSETSQTTTQHNSKLNEFSQTSLTLSRKGQNKRALMHFYLYYIQKACLYVLTRINCISVRKLIYLFFCDCTSCPVTGLKLSSHFSYYTCTSYLICVETVVCRVQCL